MAPRVLHFLHIELEALTLNGPDVSTLCLFSQPTIEGDEAELDYDSGDESDAGDRDGFEDEDEDDDPFSNAPAKKENLEHSNPNSYSWLVDSIYKLST